MKVRFLPYQPHCFAFGGFDLQMLKAFDELKKLEIDIEKLNLWDRNSNFDILHCWGLGLANYENILWGKKAGKKIIVTSLHGYYETNVEVLKFYMSSIIYKQRLHKEMIKSIDLIVAVNDKQAEICCKLFGISEKKIKIIPHIVDDRFFFRRECSEIKTNKNYILTVGNVCKRKNQIKLTLACIEANVPLIIIGKPLEGEENYARQLDELVKKNENMKWIKGLNENSDSLIDYFDECLAMALPSFIEQQPIALLEAAVLNKPLIIANKAYAKQKYYSNAQLVNPKSIDSIKNGIQNVVENPQKYRPKYEPMYNCKGTNASNAYMNLYKELLS